MRLDGVKNILDAKACKAANNDSAIVKTADEIIIENVEKAIKLFGGQKPLADSLGIKQSAVSNWLKGKNNVSELSATKIEILSNKQIKASSLCLSLAKLEKSNALQSVEVRNA